MINRKSYLLLICGIAGIILYVLLRPEIEFYSASPINESKKEIVEKLTLLSPQLGFSTDTMASAIYRRQHTRFLEQLNDSSDHRITPHELNNKNIHLQSWVVDLGPRNSSSSFFDASVFNSAGNLQLMYSNYGKVIRIKEHPDRKNPTFIRGDSLVGIGAYVVGELFNYDLSNYELLTSASSMSENGSIETGVFRNDQENVDTDGLTLIWKKSNVTANTVDELKITLKPVVREFTEESGFRTEFGYSISSFIAKNEHEPDQLIQAQNAESWDNQLFTYLFFITVFILSIFVFSVGLRNIFKGKVEWRRALIIFFVIAAGIYSWRAIYYMNSYNPFLTTNGEFIAHVNMVILALVMGLYGALAYISWEALARAQKFSQVELVDALWQRKLFVSETGSALVHGVSFGGILIGIFALISYLVGVFIIQSDSQFGFTEAGISQRLLTINISALITAWLVCIAQIGFVNAILSYWIKRKWVSGILTIVLVAVFTTVMGRLIGTTGMVDEDLFIYLGLSIVAVFAVREFGILTLCTAWWIFVLFYQIQPYIGSPSVQVAYVSWVQMFIMAAPLIYGFIAYRYGVSVIEIGEYIPEYEERIAQHLRVEKEIEIARESQYKLMPVNPPKAPGMDVYGFFLPSFEVGGDYFDYVLSHDDDGKPSALTMAVVDVSGKSMRAAMPAVFTSGLLLSRMKVDNPAEILNQVNEPIFLRTDKRTFITCVLARYDLRSNYLSVANAGHCQPIIKRNGVSEFITTPEPRYPLGIKEKVIFSQHDIKMKKGDVLLLYSDGLPEAVNEKGERFGFDSVPRLLENIETELMTAQEITQEIKRTIQKFSNHQLADDTTILCLKI